MTKFILYVATSIDGYIARPDGIDWLPSPEVDAEYDGYAKFYDSIDALVMGSMTYEQVLGFEIGYQANLMPIDNTRTLQSPFRRSYTNEWLMGGGFVASSFIRED